MCNDAIHRRFNVHLVIHTFINYFIIFHLLFRFISIWTRGEVCISRAPLSMCLHMFSGALFVWHSSARNAFVLFFVRSIAKLVGISSALVEHIASNLYDCNKNGNYENTNFRSEFWCNWLSGVKMVFLFCVYRCDFLNCVVRGVCDHVRADNSERERKCAPIKSINSIRE